MVSICIITCTNVHCNAAKLRMPQHTSPRHVGLSRVMVGAMQDVMLQNPGCGLTGIVHLNLHKPTIEVLMQQDQDLVR